MPFRIDRGQSCNTQQVSFFFPVGNRSTLVRPGSRTHPALAHQSIPSIPVLSLSLSLLLFPSFPSFLPFWPLLEDIYTGIESSRDGQSGCSGLALTSSLSMLIDGCCSLALHNLFYFFVFSVNSSKLLVTLLNR